MKKLTSYGIGLLAFSLLLSVSSCKSKDAKSDENKKGTSSEKQSVIKDDKLFGFLLGGVYFIDGYGGPDRVYNSIISSEVSAKPGSKEFLDEIKAAYEGLLEFPFKFDNGQETQSSIRMLKQYWDINNKADLLARLEDLKTKGHQDAYLQCRKALDENGGENADIAKIDLKKYNLTEDKDRLDFVKNNYKKFSKSGIKSWDLARYVNNVCAGYSAGYLSEKEGLDLLAQIVPVARQNYSSWEEYISDWTLGRQFWGGDPSGDKRIGEESKKLLETQYNLFQYMPL